MPTSNSAVHPAVLRGPLPLLGGRGKGDTPDQSTTCGAPSTGSFDDELLHFRARLVKLKGAEAWAERFGNGVESRAVMAAFILAFTMTDLSGIAPETDWESPDLFRANVILLVLSTAASLFSTISLSIIAAAIARNLGRTDVRYGDTDDIEIITQTLTHADPNPWFELNGSEHGKAEVDPIDLSSMQPMCANWLNGRSGADGSMGFHRVPTPRKVVKYAGNAFLFALVAYMASIAIKLADLIGVAFGIGMGAILVGSIAAALLVLKLSDSLDID